MGSNKSTQSFYKRNTKAQSRPNSTYDNENEEGVEKVILHDN